MGSEAAVDSGQAETTRTSAPAGSRATSKTVPLAEALALGWVEFWYQPKIDLRTMRMVGVETLARVRHPVHGILNPGSFLPGAHKSSLSALAQQALITALKEGLQFSKMGISVRFAVNMSLDALMKLPIEVLVRRYRAPKEKWPGLIFDVPESELLNNVAQVREIIADLTPFGINFAIDDFGSCISSALDPQNRGQAQVMLDEILAKLLALKNVSIAEMKLDRAFVKDCGTNARHGAICKVFIDLAHCVGSTAVAIGAESANDIRALQSMNCDVGQGYLFGEPLSKVEFSGLVRNHANKQFGINMGGSAPPPRPYSNT